MKTITIKLTGDEFMQEYGLEYAIKGIKDGNRCGFDSSDDGSYYFEVKEDNEDELK